jgi:hypothetical protein
MDSSVDLQELLKLHLLLPPLLRMVVSAPLESTAVELKEEVLRTAKLELITQIRELASASIVLLANYVLVLA